MTTYVRVVRTNERGESFLHCARCESRWIRPPKHYRHAFTWSCPGCGEPGPFTEQQHIIEKKERTS